MIAMKKTTERFLRYVSYDTQSNEDSSTYPSTASQSEFSHILAADCEAIGLSDVHVDKHGYVISTIPGNTPGVPVIGLIAHMDTAPAAPGKDIKPRLVTYYGEPIILNAAENLTLSADQFPELNNWIGESLIVTDGTTLLGSDDKAGIVEIMAAAEHLLSHPEIPHGDIKIAFTPDEEIGNGTLYFDVPAFGADFGYTVDGGTLGEIEYENFNAASAEVLIKGISIHTGTAKNKMINAILVAHQFQSMLPPAEIPACTEGYEGFFHLRKVEGAVEHTRMVYNIREHDKTRFLRRKAQMWQIVAYLNSQYGEGTVTLKITDTLGNMADIIAEHMDLIDKAKEAFSSCGIKPVTPPIRGGTDGARLSFKGLPCPNLSTGGQNFHGRQEWIAENAMEKMAEVLVTLVRSFAE